MLWSIHFSIEYQSYSIEYGVLKYRIDSYVLGFSRIRRGWVIYSPAIGSIYSLPVPEHGNSMLLDCVGCSGWLDGLCRCVFLWLYKLRNTGAALLVWKPKSGFGISLGAHPVVFSPLRGDCSYSVISSIKSRSLDLAGKPCGLKSDTMLNGSWL